MTVPELDIDLYADDTLLGSDAVYAQRRALGPIVYLPKNGLYAVTQ